MCLWMRDMTGSSPYDAANGGAKKFSETALFTARFSFVTPFAWHFERGVEVLTG